MRALVVVRCLLVMAVVFGSAGAGAAKQKSFMLVPSPTTILDLERLTREEGTTVDVVTVNGQEHHLVLDGSGGDALSGRDVGAVWDQGDVPQAVLIPFDDAALIYYRADGSPDKEEYPQLPKVSTVEQGWSCEQLALDLRRAEAIRWVARQQVGATFTGESNASGGLAGKPGAKAGLIAGGVVLAPLIVSFALMDLIWHPTRYFHGSHGLPAPVSDKSYRRAVTAADRRELGLLELERHRRCTPVETGTEGGSDLTILERIESSRQELAAKKITRSEQTRQQTQLLDQLYPVPRQTPALAPVENIQETVEATPAELRP